MGIMKVSDKAETREKMLGGTVKECQVYKMIPLLAMTFLCGIGANTLANQLAVSPTSQRESNSMVDAMGPKPRFLLTSNLTSLGMLNELLDTECADLECASRAFEAKEAKADHSKLGHLVETMAEKSIFDEYMIGFGVALVVCSLHFAASTCCKQTLKNGGVPPVAVLETLKNGEGPLHSAEAMTELVLGNELMIEQARCQLNQIPITYNRPWLAEPAPEFGLGGGGTPGQEETTVGAFGHFRSYQDWLNFKRFPNGETRTDSPLHMSFGVWGWMMHVSGNNWWSFLTKIIQGLLLPCQAQLLAQLFGVLDGVQDNGSPDSKVVDFVHDILNSRGAVVLFLLALLLAVHFVIQWSQWAFDIEVPYAAPMREIRIRMMTKLMAIQGEEEKNWPSGRCVYIAQEDVAGVICSWGVLFEIVQNICSVFMTLVITSLTSTKLSHALKVLPLLLLVVAFAFLDLFTRIDQIDDLVERKRTWLAAECAMMSRELEDKRKVSKAKERGDTAAAADEEKKVVAFERAFYCASFVAWYRVAHAYFVTLGAQNMIGSMNKMLLYLVISVDAYGVISGTKTMQEFTSDVFLANFFISVVSSLHGHFITLLKNTPAIRAVAEVLNMGETFKEEDEEEEEFSDEAEDNL